MAYAIKKSAIEIAVIILAIASIWFASEISTFSSLLEADAKWWLRASEILLVVSAVIVFAGLAGEWPESKSWRNRLIYKAAKWTVLIGIGGELLGDAAIFLSGDRVQSIDGNKISELEHHLTARALSDPQNASVLAAISGSPFVVHYAFSITNDEEAGLAIALSESVFSKADWKWVGWPRGRKDELTVTLPGRPPVGFVILNGIQVRV